MVTIAKQTQLLLGTLVSKHQLKINIAFCHPPGKKGKE